MIPRVAVAGPATGRESDSPKNLSSLACRGTSNYSPRSQVALGNALALHETLFRAGLCLLVASTLSACSSAVTPDKMSQVKTRMTSDQVRTLLGDPTRIEQSDTTGLTGEVDIYTAPNGEGRVVYLNNAVFKSEFVPGAKKS